MAKELFLVRGLPGSGKSTLAKALGGVHLEADMYFTDPQTGEYKFDPSKIKSAHEWCRDMTEMNMKSGRERIVVSNTFTQDWEMEPYFDLSKNHGYRVYSLISENRHGGTNVHGVPPDKLNLMRSRFSVKL